MGKGAVSHGNGYQEWGHPRLRFIQPCVSFMTVVSPCPLWASFVKGKAFIDFTLLKFFFFFEVSLVTRLQKWRETAQNTLLPFMLDMKFYNLIQILIHCTNESGKMPPSSLMQSFSRRKTFSHIKTGDANESFSPWWPDCLFSKHFLPSSPFHSPCCELSVDILLHEVWAAMTLD